MKQRNYLQSDYVPNKTELKEQKNRLQQQHKSRFLEAPLVWQADGELTKSTPKDGKIKIS